MKKTIDNYSLKENLGEGVYGHVYRAVNMKTGQEVAIKTIPVKKFHQIPKLQEFTINQIRILSEINEECPYIVRYIDMLKTVNNFYFVYEFCNGGTLAKMLSTEGKINEKKAMIYLKQILEAFRVLSKKNIMHRDLKPQNILFHNGVVRLADFGFCKLLGNKDDLAQTMLGSPLYMAPEVLKGQIYTIKADIWSLGVVTYQMLFGKCPFQSKTIACLIKIFEVQELCFPPTPKIGHALQEFIKRCLVKDYNLRIGWQEIFQTFHITDEGDMVNKKEIMTPFLGNEIRASLRETTGSSLRQPALVQNYNPSYRNTINYSINSPEMTLLSPKGSIPQLMNSNNYPQNQNANNSRFLGPQNQSKTMIMMNRSPSKIQQRSTINYGATTRQYPQQKNMSLVEEVENPRSGQNSNKSSQIYGQIKKSGTSLKTESSHHIETNGQNTSFLQANQGDCPTSALLNNNKLQNTRLDIIIKNHSRISLINELTLEIVSKEHKYADYLCYYIFTNLAKEIDHLAYKVQQNRNINSYQQMKNVLDSENYHISEIMKSLREGIAQEREESQSEYNKKEELDAWIFRNKGVYLKRYVDCLPESDDDVRAASQIIDYLLQGILIKKDAYERMSKQHLLKQMRTKISKQNC